MSACPSAPQVLQQECGARGGPQGGECGGLRGPALHCQHCECRPSGAGEGGHVVLR